MKRKRKVELPPLEGGEADITAPCKAPVLWAIKYRHIPGRLICNASNVFLPFKLRSSPRRIKRLKNWWNYCSNQPSWKVFNCMAGSWNRTATPGVVEIHGRMTKLKRQTQAVVIDFPLESIGHLMLSVYHMPYGPTRGKIRVNLDTQTWFLNYSTCVKAWKALWPNLYNFTSAYIPKEGQKDTGTCPTVDSW